MHMEEDWDYFQADRVLSLSLYLGHLAYDFGLPWQRTLYGHGAEAAPVEYDPVEQLAQVTAGRKFPGDFR